MDIIDVLRDRNEPAIIRLLGALIKVGMLRNAGAQDPLNALWNIDSPGMEVPGDLEECYQYNPIEICLVAVIQE